MSFNKDVILSIQEKLLSKKLQPKTEEATKQWFIMPLLTALGYDQNSSDIIPEYTLDIGVKKGEKVDYVLQINNQPVILVECKQLNVALSTEKHLSQLYRYFTISNAHIGILTNGDDYWFFTDSQKENIMDLEPYYKLKISEAEDSEIDKLAQYCKDLIQSIDIVHEVQYERYINTCKELAHELRTNNIPSWLLKSLADKSGLPETNRDMTVLAEYLYTEIYNEFSKFGLEAQVYTKKTATKTPKVTSALGDKMRNTRIENKKNISKIKLNHEYTYNDYSDGDWKFHILDYAIILGEKFENITGRALLINTITKLLKEEKIKREECLKDERFQGVYKITEDGGYRGAHYIEEYNIYISTSYGIDGIIKFIERLLEFAGIRDSEIKISFKE